MEWPWDLELVFVNINKLICKLVEGLRFFKAEYNSILDGQKRTKNGPKMVYYGVKMIKNVHNRLRDQNQAGNDPIQSYRK